MKTSAARNFGVQSFCFRETRDIGALASKVTDIGLDKIEVCRRHADFNDIDSWKGIVDTLGQEGISVCSVGVQDFVGAPEERNWFECARIAGARHISAHFKVDSFTTAIPATAALAQEYGIRVGIHCHGGFRFGGSPDVLEYMLQLGGPSIGLCLDTAWCIQIGPREGKPLEWVKRFAGRIYGVHYKDFVFDSTSAWRDVIVGTGNLNLPAFVEALEASGFDGMAVLEYEASPENPTPALKECVASMRAVCS